MGLGKSFMGNIFCGREVFGFYVLEFFVIKICQFVEMCQFGCYLSIVDIFGFFDMLIFNDVIMIEVMCCLVFFVLGFYVFIYVFNVFLRFIVEEEDLIKQFVEYFGEWVFDYMIVVFI